MKRVAIIHPWFPEYRREFFEQLVPRAADRGIDVRVAYGAAPPEWASRGDVISSPVATELPTSFIRVGRSHAVFKSLRPLGRLRDYDLVVVEDALRNLETVGLLARRVPLAFWGQGRTYTKPVGRTATALKRMLALRGRWFFAYTAGGARYLESIGFDARRITVLNNSIDSTALAASVASVAQSDIDAYRASAGLRGRSALFIGGVDEHKRIPFLLDAADVAAALDPDFRLVVAGDGPLVGLVRERAARRPHLIVEGRVSGDRKALVMAATEVLAIPGRVGLVAVDSFAVQRPIVTTSSFWHAPEFEYLAPSNSIVTDDSVEAFARGLVDVLSDPVRLQSLRAGCAIAAPHYTTEAMVSNFLAGLEATLDG